MPEQVPMPSPMPKAIRVFLSYPSHQKDLAEYVASQLREQGIDPGAMHEDVGPGVDLREEIKRQIQGSDAVIALITRDSLKSEWLSYELGVASGLDRRVIPIVMDVPSEELPKQVSDRAMLKLDDLKKVRAMMDAK